MNETTWQGQVVELAGILGWQHMHARRSRGKGGKWTTATNVDGWPDLTLWHPTRGLAFAELKTDERTSQCSPDQVRVLLSLDLVAPAYVWRPADLEVVQSVLVRGAHWSGAHHLRAAQLFAPQPAGAPRART